MFRTEDLTKEDRLMHRVLKPFEFFEPKTVAEAVRLLPMYGARIRLY